MEEAVALGLVGALAAFHLALEASLALGLRRLGLAALLGCRCHRGVAPGNERERGSNLSATGLTMARPLQTALVGAQGALACFSGRGLGGEEGTRRAGGGRSGRRGPL